MPGLRNPSLHSTAIFLQTPYSLPPYLPYVVFQKDEENEKEESLQWWSQSKQVTQYYGVNEEAEYSKSPR